MIIWILERSFPIMKLIRDGQMEFSHWWKGFFGHAKKLQKSWLIMLWIKFWLTWQHTVHWNFHGARVGRMEEDLYDILLPWEGISGGSWLHGGHSDWGYMCAAGFSLFASHLNRLHSAADKDCSAWTQPLDLGGRIIVKFNSILFYVRANLRAQRPIKNLARARIRTQK
jgi:hypothetical protein